MIFSAPVLYDADDFVGCFVNHYAFCSVDYNAYYEKQKPLLIILRDYSPYGILSRKTNTRFTRACSSSDKIYYLVKCSVEFFTDYFTDGVSAVTCPALYLPKNIPSSTYLSAWETHIGNFPVFIAV